MTRAAILTSSIKSWINYTLFWYLIVTAKTALVKFIPS